MEKNFVEKIENVESFVNEVILNAIKNNASDIHFEPREDNFYIRYRIDGELIDVYQINSFNAPIIISRIKIISKMDITIKRMPQDGRLDFDYNGNLVDIRVASVPVILGEKIVMRILNAGNFKIDIENLGLYDEERQLIENIIKSPNGVLIISGPTGSGKSSTLYSFVKKLQNENINIITLEDPVEVRISGINQININSALGLDFATGLRAMLRQDFEVGLVGEMRDRETANIALRAGITGHLIFTTLHTADTVSAIIRLLNLGIENYVISSGVIAILSQRLVRKLCPHCKKEDENYKEKLKSLNLSEEKYKNVKFYTSGGCEKCMGTGYIGRIPIFEIIYFDDILKDMLAQKKEIKQNFKTLLDDAMDKAKEGLTSLDEIMRQL